MYICAQHTFLWRLNNHFVRQVGTDSSNKFLGICLIGNSKLMIMIGALLFFIDLVITSYISPELANTVWLKLETCVISQCFGGHPL